MRTNFRHFIQVTREIFKVDKHVGLLLQKLKDAGFLECVNLLIVSDHGTLLYDAD